jgi:hypothetical protein
LSDWLFKPIFTYKKGEKVNMLDKDGNEIVEPLEDEELLDDDQQEEVVDDDTIEDDDTQADDDQEDSREDVVPLKTHLNIKSQNRELKKRLSQLEKAQYSSEALEYKNKVKTEYLDAGYDEKSAEMLSKHLAEIREVAMTKKQPSLEDQILDEINDLAETDEFYSDALKYQDNIVLKIREFKNKGADLSVEDAYILVRNARVRHREVTANKKQREILRNKQTGKTGKTNVPTGKGTPLKQTYKLDDNDKKALTELQKAQPDKNWTSKKYYEIMKK